MLRVEESKHPLMGPPNPHLRFDVLAEDPRDPPMVENGTDIYRCLTGARHCAALAAGLMGNLLKA